MKMQERFEAAPYAFAWGLLLGGGAGALGMFAALLMLGAIPL